MITEETANPSRRPADAAPARMQALSRLPVFFALTRKRVVVVGGNAAAAWKVELLAAAGAAVEVYASAPCDELRDIALAPPAGSVEIFERPWQQAVFDGATLAIGAESWLEGENPAVPPDEVARRKARGSELLWNLLERGHCDVLPTLIGAYAGASDSPLAVDVEPDPAQAYSLMQALVLWRAEAPLPDDDTDWQQGLPELAQKLDPAQLAAATAQGQVIYEHYCRGRPHDGE